MYLKIKFNLKKNDTKILSPLTFHAKEEKTILLKPKLFICNEKGSNFILKFFSYYFENYYILN